MMNRRFLLLAAALLGPPAASVAGSVGPAQEAGFGEAAGLLRAGRHAAAYGRFVALADAGNRDAARIALVMHRYARALFASDWDATTEQLEDWSHLARLGEAADIAARRFAGPTGKSSAAAAVANPGELRLDTFVPHRPRR